MKENRDSNERLTYFDPVTNKHLVPYVIEPSVGVGRAFLAVLCEAYDESPVRDVPAERLKTVEEALGAFLKSVQKSEKLSEDQRGALIREGERIAGDLAMNSPQIHGLLGMPGADQIELGKKLRGQAEPVADEFFRTVLHLKPALAPIKVAVLPLEEERRAHRPESQGDQADAAGGWAHPLRL